jgi:uncharacterized protein (DUF1330 family)
MVSTIDQAFIEEYNADVHLLFRQFGSRLIGMSRKGMVMAKTVRWQKFGFVVAQTKGRNAQHTFQDPAHSYVQANMADWYVPTLIDDLDLLKLNIDEKNSHVRAHVAALAKKADQILIDTMEAGAASDLGDATKGWSYGMAMSVVTTFDVNEVPDDGRRYCALHPYAWSQMLQIPEFANADYVGAENLPFKGGMQAKSWLGILWFPLPNIYFEKSATGTSGGGVATVQDQCLNLAWHGSIVGHGVNKEIDTKWDWENTYSAWSCVSCMSLGAAIIEDLGCYTVSSLSPKPVA